jgi:molybdopterin converting factor small subunit
MRVRIKYFGLLRSRFQRDPEEADLSEGARLRDLFSYLTDRHGEEFVVNVFNPTEKGIREDVLVNLNDVPVRQMKGLDTELSEGDQIDILALFLGGG